MINRLAQTVALVYPAEKVTSLLTRHPKSALLALNQLQLTLDKALNKQYARKSQGFLEKKINSDSPVKNNSHFSR